MDDLDAIDVVDEDDDRISCNTKMLSKGDGTKIFKDADIPAHDSME